MDYSGLSILIGAVAGAIALLGGFALQVAAFVRAGRIEELSKKTHDLVNGQSEKLEVLTFKAGEVSGADKERASPTTGNLPVEPPVTS